MLRIDHVVGSRLETAYSEEIHRLEHRGAVDEVNIPVADLRDGASRLLTMRSYTNGPKL